MTLLADIIWSRVGFGVLLVVGLAVFAGVFFIAAAKLLSKRDAE